MLEQTTVEGERDMVVWMITELIESRFLSPLTEGEERTYERLVRLERHLYTAIRDRELVAV